MRMWESYVYGTPWEYRVLSNLNLFKNNHHTRIRLLLQTLLLQAVESSHKYKQAFHAWTDLIVPQHGMNLAMCFA